MKKIYTFMTFLLVACFTFGQMLQMKNESGLLLKKTKKVELNHSLGKATIDTAGWTIGWNPCFLSPDASQVQAWGMTNQGGNLIGYWFGTSGYPIPDSLEQDYWAQCWANGASLKVSGILYWAAGKTQLSSGTGSDMIVGIMNVVPYVANAHGCIIATTPTYTFGPSPNGSMLKSATVNIVDFDTTFTNFNWVPFTGLATVTGDFAAVANFKGMRTAGDTAYMFADVTGDGLGLNYTQYCPDPTGYYWFSTYQSSANAQLDVNMSIFAVIDDGAGINDEGYFQGMKMSLRNNPSKDITYVDYMLQYNTKAKLFVYDMNGREIAVYDEGNKAAGFVNSIAVNTSNFAKGTYFIALSAGGGRFTKKLVVD